jgi:hypothetical protein
MTITQVEVTSSSCNDSFSTPSPYGKVDFPQVMPEVIVATAACSSTTICTPAAPYNVVQHVKASYLTDGQTTFSGWDQNSLSSDYECWGGPYYWGNGGALPKMPIYVVPVTGYPGPGMKFSVTPE